MSLQTIKLFEMCYIFTYIHMSAYFGEYIVLYMKYVNIRISCKHTHIYSLYVLFCMYTSNDIDPTSDLIIPTKNTYI